MMKKWQKVGRGVPGTECCLDWNERKAETKAVCQFDRKKRGLTDASPLCKIDCVMMLG